MGSLTENMPGIRRSIQPVFIKRNDPVREVDHAALPTVFFQPDVNYEEAPQPVPSTAFYAYGRDPLHAPTPLARIVNLNIRETLSHMAWPFALRTEVTPMRPVGPSGQFNPIRERVTISMPKQTTLSDQVTVEAFGGTLPSLAKITS